MGFSSSNKKGPVSDINVTPLVDVMLVLLIIFMVTAPMMFSGIKLTLPKTSKADSIHLKPELVILSITSQGQYYIGKRAILYKELIPQLQKELKASQNQTVYLRADFQLRYEKVAKLMAKLKGSGITQIALVTEEDGSTPL